MPDSKTCPSCGARLSLEAERCDLCGTSIASTPDETDPSGEATVSAEDSQTNTGPFCNECGWKNPSGANFCSRCGHPLQDVSREEAAPKVSPPPGTKPAEGPKEIEPETAPAKETASPASNTDGLGRRIALVTGAAALVVAGLFLISSWSAGNNGASSNASPQGPAAKSGGAPSATAPGTPSSRSGDATRRPLPNDLHQWAGADVPSSIAEKVDSLQQASETQSGAQQQRTQRELVRLLVGGGRPDRAALAQWALARTTDTAKDWRQAADLLMEWTGTADRARRPRLARRAADAYQRVLEETPDDPDVRLGLASAYVTTNNPMRGINEIKSILKDHPDHLRTRMFYGMMQLQIGRSKAALEQFKRVQATAGEESPFYQQAERAIQEIKRQSDGPPTNAPLPSGRAPLSGETSAPSSSQESSDRP